MKSVYCKRISLGYYIRGNSLKVIYEVIIEGYVRSAALKSTLELGKQKFGSRLQVPDDEANKLNKVQSQVPSVEAPAV